MTAKTKSAPAPAPAAPTTALLPAPSRAYLAAAVNEATGEVVERSRFKYLPGHPRQIRFDGKAGSFNVGGGDVLGKSLSFIPVALRVFEDNILGIGRKLWAEVFYFNEAGILCGLLFHGYSCENLQRLHSELFYDDLHLTQVVLTATAVKKENKKVGGSYFIAEFSHLPADPAEVRARQEFAADFEVYREETLTATAQLRVVSGYRVPERYQLPDPAASADPAQLAAAA